MSNQKILFVCLGNICRSPLADGLLRRKVRENNLTVEVDSAGTAAYHIGNVPDERMIKTAAKNGTDISFLKARQFKSKDFLDFDRIYVMDKQNLANVLKLAQNENDRKKVALLLELNPKSELREVPDPYYDGQEVFDFVYTLVDQTIDILIENLKNDR